MKSIQARLTIGMLLAALLVLSFFGTIFIGGSIAVFYRNAGLTTLMNVAQIAALVAAAGLFAAAIMIAVPTALQPGGWGRKLLSVIPALSLLLLLGGVVSSLLGIGTTSALTGGRGGPGGITFATTWLAIGAVLSTITIVIAAARANLSTKMRTAAMKTLGLTSVPGLIAALALIVSVVIVVTNQPTTPAFGGFEGPQGGQFPSSGFDAPAGQNRAQRPPEQEGSGGRGFANGLSSARTSFEAGGALTVVLGAIAAVAALGGWRALRTSSAQASASAATPSGRPEIGRTIASGAIVTAVALIAIQFVPVSRTNPPVQTAVQWNSPQTQQLWTRACADCHSNETRWPWFTTIAPTSWLAVLHVNSGRQQLNISEMNSRRLSELPNEAAQQIRNGAMPPKDYVMLHPEANLSDAERQQLIQGLQSSLK